MLKETHLILLSISPTFWSSQQAALVFSKENYFLSVPHSGFLMQASICTWVRVFIIFIIFVLSFVTSGGGTDMWTWVEFLSRGGPVFFAPFPCRGASGSSAASAVAHTHLDFSGITLLAQSNPPISPVWMIFTEYSCWQFPLPKLIYHFIVLSQP